MKEVRLIKMCLNETYSKVRIGKHLSDRYPIQNCLKKKMLYRHCSSTLIKIRNAHENQVGLKLNGIHQLLVYADDVNLLGDHIDTIKKNTETLIDAGKEVGC
jgi:hypothetical protein